MSPTNDPVELVEGYSTLREQRYGGVLALAWELGRQPLQREASERLGVSRSYAASLMNDPDGTVERARKDRYRGTCEECCGQTDGSNGPGKAPKVCLACITKNPQPARVRATYPIWNEQKCLDSIVRWVERNGSLPRGVDLTHAELGERPCLGTIMRHCYRYEERTSRSRDYTPEQSLRRERFRELGDWRSLMQMHPAGPWRKSRWMALTHSLADVLVELAPRLPVAAVVTARNAWVRARLFEVIGVENIVREAGRRITSDEVGVLWRIEREEWPAPVVMVEVVNSTPEPDGTFRTYFLRVPPDTETPRAGVAWTFDIEAHEYELAVQT